MDTRWMVTVAMVACGCAAARGERPDLPVLRVPLGEGPTVDGDLNDTVWQRAEAAGGFLQYEPDVGRPMTERTEVRMVCDGRTLFLGVWCFDRDPGAIVARKMFRDGYIFSDDYVYFAFDTFLDRRNGYIFALNPNGTRYDALGTDNSSVDRNWDGVWTVRTRITGEGWFAEVALPLRTISFDPDQDRWGFNLSRMIRRRNERGRWHRALPAIRTSMMSEAGDLTGLAGLQPGLGFEIAPYLTGTYRESASGNDSWLGDVGVDVRSQITPSLHATLSLNTDFAETEVDPRLLNFGRFPLFFPEKRDFFLEDQSAFQFGGLFQRNYGFRNGILPFFSRRIGRDEDGKAEPIRMAAKVTGRAGDWNLGLLDVWTEHDGDERNLFVGRLSRALGESSSLGLIGTWGDPIEDHDAGTLGADVRFRNSDILGGQILEGSAFAMATTKDGPEGRSDEAFGAVLSFPNDLVYASAKFLQVGEGVDPTLGFVRRTGIRGYASNFSWQPRPSGIDWLRQYKLSALTESITDLDNDLGSAEYTFFPAQFEFETGEEIQFKVEREFDAPDEAFELFEEIEISPRDYWWTRYEIDFDTARKRSVSSNFEVNWGDFYDGRRLGADASTNVALSRHFNLNLHWGWDRLDFDDAETLDVHNLALKGIVNWSPDLSLVNYVQYDTASENLGWFSRLQWEYASGRRCYAVLKQSYLREDGTFREEETEATLKLGAAWWF